jgi:hypothetical protein
MSTPRFPSLEWFRALAERLNADDEFRELARWATARVGFSVTGHPTFALSLAAGRVTTVEEGEGLTGVDYAIEGPPEGWDVFFDERGCLPLAINSMHGRLRLRGNLVLAAGDNWTLSNIVRRFRLVPGPGVAA